MLTHQKINQKSLRSSLFLFDVLYFAMVLVEKQMVRKGYFGFQLPFKFNLLGIFIGFAAGNFLIIGLVILLKKHVWIIRLCLVSILVLGSIYINYFNFMLFYPPYLTTRPGDLDELGEKWWNNQFSYNFYAGLHDEYYLHTVLANPEFEDYAELKRAVGFGLYWEDNISIPIEIDRAAFEELNGAAGDEYLTFTNDGVKIRLYQTGDSDQIVLTRFGDIILFLPSEVILE